jgi:hypothetical protein
MSAWEEHRLTCMHGIQEGEDYHDCPQCRQIAERLGKTWIPRQQTYLFLKLPKELKGTDLDPRALRR